MTRPPVSSVVGSLVLVAALVYPLVSGAYDLFLGTSAVVSAVVLAAHKIRLIVTKVALLVVALFVALNFLIKNRLATG